MTKLHLTYIKREMRTSKAGKPFESVSIKAQEYGQTYIGGFGNFDNKNWKEGMEVEVASVDKKDYNGKEYLNFTMPQKPKAEDLLRKSEDAIKGLEALEAKFNAMAEAIRPMFKEWKDKQKVPSLVKGTDIVYPENEYDNGPFDDTEVVQTQVVEAQINKNW